MNLDDITTCVFCKKKLAKHYDRNIMFCRNCRTPSNIYDINSTHFYINPDTGTLNISIDNIDFFCSVRENYINITTSEFPYNGPLIVRQVADIEPDISTEDLVRQLKNYKAFI